MPICGSQQGVQDSFAYGIEQVTTKAKAIGDRQ
jgi:hypothetical protein